MKEYKLPGKSYVDVTEMTFDELNKTDFALCPQPTQTPDDYYKECEIKPDVIMNGGFYALSTGQTCFSFTDEDVQVSKYSGQEGIGIMDNKTLKFGYQDDLKDCRDFICGYPVLVKDGKAFKSDVGKELNYKARRTMLGYNSTKVFGVTVDAPGLLFNEMKEIMLSLGCTYAINLDGGGSTRKLVNGERVTDVVYARPVDNVVCFYLNKSPKEELPKAIYRVQVGAFRYKGNAESLQKTLYNKGFTDSFIIKVVDVYKVQLGAFSIKDNAMRLREQLKTAGFDAFITEVRK